MASLRQRENGDGTKVWEVQVRLKGHPQQTATFRRKTDAKAWAQQTEAAIREGRHFRTVEARRHTLGELVDRYITDVLPTKPKSEAKQKAQLEWWKAELGAYVLADVTPALLAEARDKLRRGVTARGTKRAPSTVVRYLAALGHAFTVAVKEWGWLETNPMSRVTKPKEPRGRVRYLDDDERTRLLEACAESRNDSLHTIVVLALSTGMRQGEILSLRWDDVDLERGRVVLNDTKNGERRAVYLFEHALSLMKERAAARRYATRLVFPGRPPKAGKPWKPMDIRSAWVAAVERANIEDFRFHDLRHCAASYLAMSGASMMDIAAVLGHKTLAMVKRYSHLSESHTAGVLRTMNSQIFGSPGSK